jgi:hypothetical protein
VLIVNEVKYEPNVSLPDVALRRSSDNNSYPPMVVAMAYVPVQDWDNVYTPEVGLNRGTIFADLDKPYIGEVMK